MRPQSRSFILFVPILLVVAAACGPAGNTAAPKPTTTASVAGSFDQQFIDMMVPHHEGAVEMAKIAQQRSQRPEVQQMASAIMTSQADEVARMKTWRLTWYGSDQTPPMNAMPMVDGMAGHSMSGHGSGSQAATTMDMAADVASLRTASDPFDRAFIDAMIPHHESAIAAAKAAGTRAEHQEVKDLATAIMRDQQGEITQLQTWRQAWFPG